MDTDSRSVEFSRTQEAKYSEPWQQWERREIDCGLVKRARGILPEMECTKQLVRLVSEIYQPGMTVLDAGCNAGHYLPPLRRIDGEMPYVGVDATSKFIDDARTVFGGDRHARFYVRDIMRPLDLGGSFHVVFCCNVLLHLPDFRGPLRNLLACAKQVCIIRTLLSESSTLALRLMSHFPEGEEPDDFYYMNTWARDFFISFAEGLGWRTELIRDEFDPEAIASEYDGVKNGDGTRVVGGLQADGTVLYSWEWAKLTRI